MKYALAYIALSIVVLLAVHFSYKAGYYTAQSEFNDVKLPYAIVDANGVQHRLPCYGYVLINADSVELCNGVKIKYRMEKPLNVIPKNGNKYGKNSKDYKNDF
jgi:hypothetical protein